MKTIGDLMGLSLSLLLKEMRKKISSNKQSLVISEEAKKNIQQIQKICNKDYFDQSFYGSTSLNRKILLDKRIASLLTPETILAILEIHIRTKKQLNKHSDIAVWRNSPNYISLAAILFYGFNEGLDAIQFMPNNEPVYGIGKYNEQKKKFAENTQTIIENLKTAAQMLDVPLDDEQLQSGENEPSLSEQFQQIEEVITKIKSDGFVHHLLNVPNYTTQAINTQSITGFQKACALLKVKYTVKEQALIMDNAISFDTFINRFLASDEVLLNGDVIHLFYDRVHLESCIQLDTKIKFQNQEYYLRDILREMVKRLETSETVSPTAKEQFKIRLKLCNKHLREAFPRYFQPAPVANVSSNDKPLGYAMVKELLSHIDKEISRALWSCGKLEKLQEEKIFLGKIIEFYDRAQGSISLKEALLLAKSDCPEGYKEFIHSRGENLFLTFLDETTTVELTHGPRQKNQASYALETLIHELLSDYKSIECTYNALNELEIIIDGKYFNVTQILLHNPDLEHIALTDSQLAKYATFATQKAKHKPVVLEADEFVMPTPQWYEKRDPKGVNAHLQYGEKLALTLYCSDFYSTIQAFLRQKGRPAELQETSPQALTKLAPELLLSSVVAAHALTKPILLKPANKESKSYRKESAETGFDFFKNRLASLKNKQPLIEPGFTSTSRLNRFYKDKANTFTVFHGEDASNTFGKKLDSISAHAAEQEVLYGPGTQFQYTDYFQIDNMHFFAAKPVRSIDGLGEDNYSEFMLAKHELEIIAKTFEQHLMKESHSAVRRVFDTVSNDRKLHCIRTAKTAIDQVLADLKPDENLTAAQLIVCKNALVTSINSNKQLVSAAFFTASLGKTDQTLQAALLRVNRALTLLESSKPALSEEFIDEVQTSPKNSLE